LSLWFTNRSPTRDSAIGVALAEREAPDAVDIATIHIPFERAQCPSPAESLRLVAPVPASGKTPDG
jgi:hypothetical protein